MVPQQVRRHLRLAGLSKWHAGWQQLPHRLREPGRPASSPRIRTPRMVLRLQPPSRPAHTPPYPHPTHGVAASATLPRLSAEGRWSPVVWQRANTGGTGDDLYGRMLWAGGRPADGEPAFALVDGRVDQESPAIAGPNPRHRTLSMCSKCEIAVSWQTNHGVTA
jgi:hypothetical protein